VGVKVDLDDLIGAAQVQSILQLSRPSSVSTYLKRYADFPRPIVDLSDSRIRLWLRQDIVEWQHQREART
jgi:predicted DNA-binding transcriptional regulator AlpA